MSLGLTAVGLVMLALMTPGPHRGTRLIRTLVGMLPLVPLGLLYRSLSVRGGAMHPEWEHLTDPFSPAKWAIQLAWVDPITLASKRAIPLTNFDHVTWFGLFADDVDHDRVPRDVDLGDSHAPGNDRQVHASAEGGSGSQSCS